METIIESKEIQKKQKFSGLVQRLVRRINRAFRRWEYANRCEHVLTEDGCEKCSMSLEEAYYDIPMCVLAYAVRKAAIREGIVDQFEVRDGRLTFSGAKAAREWGDANKEKVIVYLNAAYAWTFRGEHSLEDLLKELDRRKKAGELA